MLRVPPFWTSPYSFYVYSSLVLTNIQLGKKDWTKRDFRSKTTLIRGGVCGTWVNPPFRKMATFIQRSLALRMSIYRNFQSNGVKWRSRKLWKQKIYLILCYMKFLFSKFDISPFDSIWLEISINWYTKSQGPMKKCNHFTKGRIHSCLADTARN